MGNSARRLDYIDNLRGVVIILVVLQHLAVTYSGFGDWYYMDGMPLSLPETALFGYYQSLVQGFFMGLLFLISGYFVPASYDRKGFGGFIVERLKRLGIPALLYMCVIHPFMVYVQLDALRDSGETFLEYYAGYIASGRFIGSTGPLWFAVALLIFSVMYALVRRFSGEKKRERENGSPLYSVKNAILLIVVIAGMAFLIRIVQPIGTSVLNMQLCFFAQYICLFVTGIAMGKNRAFEELEYRHGRRWLFAVLVPGFVVWVVVMFFGGALEGGTAHNGGLTWQSLAYAAWESFVAVGISAGLIAVFRARYNRQNRVQKLISDNAFAVYMFHAPIIVFTAQLARPLSILPIFKFLLLSVISVPLCFVLAHVVLRRIPLLKRVL